MERSGGRPGRMAEIERSGGRPGRTRTGTGLKRMKLGSEALSGTGSETSDAGVTGLRGTDEGEVWSRGSPGRRAPASQ